jgi:ribosomal protein S18 acetylase RimI-like enzyme
MSTPLVRRATPADVAPAAGVLGRAFADYPWTRWTVDARGHEDRVRRLQALVLEDVGLPHGEVWVATVDGEIAGVAVWTGDVPAAVWDAMADEVRVLEGDRHEASRAAGAACDDLRPVTPHITLGTVGTDPAVQRRGIGAAVLVPRLAQPGLLYLETSTADNVRFYERRGFTVTGHVEIPGGPDVWGMTRAAL